MAAATAVDVSILNSLPTNGVVNTNKRKYEIIVLEMTVAATSDTYDLSTVMKVTGVIHPLGETYDEAVKSTAASTWSGTTVTFAGFTGSGRYKGTWVVYN
jgi:hypothetical protein